MRWCPSKRRNCGSPRAQTDGALAAGLVPYSTTAHMNQAIADALLPYGTVAQRDAAIAAALAAYYTSAQTDAAIAAAIAPYYTSAETDAAIAAAQLSNGQSWNGGPTFNLLRGSNVLRNLSVAGALTASFQNLDDTILIESDSYARSETYTQAETGAAITAAIDALDLSQFQNEAEVQALIAGPVDLRGGRAGQRHQQLGDLGHLLGPVQLRRQQPGRFQDHHGSVGFLHPDRSRSRDCQCAGERGSVELLPRPRRRATWPACWRTTLGPSWIPSSRPPSCSTGPAREPKPRSTTPSPARASSPKRRPTRGGQRQRKLRVPGAHQRDAPNDQGAPASGAGGQHHPLGHHARAHLRRLHQGGSGRALFEQQQLRAARRQVLPQQPVGGRGQRPLPPRPGAVHAPLHPQPALLPPPSSLLPPSSSLLPPPSSSLLPAPSLLLPPPSSPLSPPPPSPLLRKRSRMGTAPQRERSDTPDPRRGFAGELKDGHGTTARALRHARSPQRVRRRAIRHARSPQRVRRRAQGFARHHSESAPTRPIPAEGSSASSRIRTAPHRSPQRVRRRAIDTPDPCRGFAGELKDSHGTTARALRHAGSPQRVHRRARGFARHHTDPRRGFAGERSDTPDPRRGFAGELKDSHGTTARALRHARSPQRVHRRAEGFARHHSESAPTRPIPVEGSSASSRIRTAPQRERSDTPDPCRWFIGELKDGHGTTARALRHARSL